DGKYYTFLLKGHEDLRLDERIMQTFNFINILLQKDKSKGSIKCINVVPVSENVGVMEYVHGCKTMHDLIKDDRQTNNVPINLEHKFIRNANSNYENSTALEKLELFLQTIDQTTGKEVNRSLWRNSI